ncbi:MAG: glycoside hydrolase [Spirochaetia bacterium]|nr:glycoside hydrolase [Spirochaetia bacterium]
MKIMKHRAGLICVFSLVSLLGLPALEETSRHIKIVETAEASAPQIMDDTVFFSCKPGDAVRYVGIAFAHEEFREIHLFERNGHGLLFLFYPIPEGLHSLDYRFVIDGLWTTDPKNPLKTRGAEGLSLSRLDLPAGAVHLQTKSPVIRRDGQVEFNLEAPSGREVYLSGSFNGWDPYMYRLREVRPGLYSLTLRLLPGTYYYMFNAEGRKYLDLLNPNRGQDGEGYEISVLVITP